MVRKLPRKGDNKSKLFFIFQNLPRLSWMDLKGKKKTQCAFFDLFILYIKDQ